MLLSAELTHSARQYCLHHSDTVDAVRLQPENHCKIKRQEINKCVSVLVLASKNHNKSLDLINVRHYQMAEQFTTLQKFNQCLFSGFIFKYEQH